MEIGDQMEMEEALKFIHSMDWRGARKGLERMEELMRRLGDPQNDLRFIHVAGTNGKGSVCAMLASILTASGFKTGLYTSPHLFRVNERMKIGCVEITDRELVELAEKVKEQADRMADRPTEFEILTAMAFLYFKEQRCDIVVLEVGLGGRLDATNIIQPPEAAVICGIGLDHTEVLGDTLEQIAAEKAAIIKPETSVILYRQSGEAEAVVRRRCQRCGVRLLVTDPSKERQVSESLTRQILDYRNRKNLRLSLLGTYQYRNAAVVLDTVDTLIGRGYSIPESAVASGLAHAEWPGRFEVLCQTPLVLVDGAHNPNGVEELTQCLERYLPERRITFVMGVMADKDYREMIRLVEPYAEQFIAVAPRSDRALSSTALAAEIGALSGRNVEDGGSVENGMALALRRSGPDAVICAFGSLYQAGEVRTFFGKT